MIATPRRRGTGALLAGALVLAACGGDAPAPTPASGRVDCSLQSAGSARAACAAVDTVQALMGAPVRTVDVSRLGPHWCVRTALSTPAAIDGAGAAVVDSAGRIVSAAVGDSIGCPAP
jgi:hypothetical protein